MVPFRKCEYCSVFFFYISFHFQLPFSIVFFICSSSHHIGVLSPCSYSVCLTQMLHLKLLLPTPKYFNLLWKVRIPSITLVIELLNVGKHWTNLQASLPTHKPMVLIWYCGLSMNKGACTSQFSHFGYWTAPFMGQLPALGFFMCGNMPEKIDVHLLP